MRTKKKFFKDFNIKPLHDYPTDEKLNDILRVAYTSAFPCYKALIKLDAIKPFSNFIPPISKDYLFKFMEDYESGDYHYVFVYQEGDKFIMSDDYYSYYSYVINGFKEIPCVVLGEPTGESVVLKGKPSLLEFPQIKVVKNS